MIDVGDIKADIANIEHQIRHLQSETIHTITILPTGKIHIVDKGQLEGLNSEVSRLSELAVHNADVLARLTDTLGEYATIESIRARKHQLEEHITRVNNILRVDTGILIRDGYDVNPGDPYSNERGKKIKQTADAALAITTPLLAAATDLLARAEGIISEFKPSGLEPQRAEQHPGVISREKVSGVVG